MAPLAAPVALYAILSHTTSRSRRLKPLALRQCPLLRLRGCSLTMTFSTEPISVKRHEVATVYSAAPVVTKKDTISCFAELSLQAFKCGGGQCKSGWGYVELKGVFFSMVYFFSSVLNSIVWRQWQKNNR